MKRILLSITMCLLISISHAQELEKLWEVAGLEAPESVVQYKDYFLVSNVSGQPAEKNGLGFISKINGNGEVLELKWINGFHAPKGLGIYNDNLYVADIDQVVVVNLESESIVKRYEVEAATFLNDIEISADGTVYISDTFGGNAIYQIKDDELSLLLHNEELDYPNGLKLNGKTLHVATWGVVTNSETFETEIPGSLLAVDLEDKSISKVSQPTGNLDGLINFNDKMIASDWIAGKLISIDRTGQTYDLIDLNAGSADIEYIEDKKVLLVPQMLDGKLLAYRIH